MKKSYLIILMVIIAAFALSLFVLALNKNQSSKNVQAKSITIKNTDIQKEIDRNKSFYKFSNQNLKNYPTLTSDAKERIIENAIIENYANSHKIKVTQNEVNERYAQKIQSSGEQKLLQQLSSMYGMGKDDYLEVLSLDILREKVQQSVNKPLADWLKEYKENLKVVIN